MAPALLNVWNSLPWLCRKPVRKEGREKLDGPLAITLRRIPASLFGVLMSINPVFAALVGALALGEALGVVQGAGILLIAAANAALAAVTGLGNAQQMLIPACSPEN